MSTSQTPNDYRVTDQVGHLLRRAYQRHTAIFGSLPPGAIAHGIAFFNGLNGNDFAGENHGGL